MKPLALSIWALLLLATPSFGQETTSSPARPWADAKEAYDNEAFVEAIDLYRQILEQGFTAPELHFNLGNALFRAGHSGRAIAQYKRALYHSPRDPDAIANLRFAFEQAGVTPPVSSPLERFFGSLPQGHWAVLAVLAYWTAALCLGTWFWRGRRNPGLLRSAAVMGVVLLVAINGFLQWRSLDIQPEVVVVEGGEDVRFAPLKDATSHFSAPEGSVFRLADRADGWLKVRLAKQTGWIPSRVCEILD